LKRHGRISGAIVAGVAAAAATGRRPDGRGLFRREGCLKVPASSPLEPKPRPVGLFRRVLRDPVSTLRELAI
jgi:hypothetical protein